MKKLKYLFAFLFFLFIAIYILESPYLNKNNKTTSKIKEQFDSFLYKYDDFEDELPVVNLNPETILNPISINKSEAFEDIDYIFSLLKYGYSGYDYFGGDKKFNQAKQNIINYLDDLNTSEVSVEDFLHIIYNNLSFIQDSHFIFGNYNLCEYTKYYSSREFEFLKDDKGLYTSIDDEIFYLKEVNEEDPNNYIKPSLDENGDIIFNLGILSNTTDVHIPINILLESNKSSRNVKVSLFEYKPLYGEHSQAYEFYEIENIPILDLNSLYRIFPKDNSIEDFIEDSKKLGDFQDIVIDLRNNTGGNLINIEKWFKGFTGKDLKQDIIESGLYTNTSVNLSKNKFTLKENEPESIKAMCLKEIDTYKKRKYFPGWSPIKYEEFKPIDNDINIIVLLDKNTSSAAEFFIHYLKKLDNVTFVGTNSNGCMLTGNSNSAHLPNSKIPLYISHKLYMRPDFVNIDGLGFLPDLWVKPEQSLDRVIKYIRKNTDK